LTSFRLGHIIEISHCRVACTATSLME
jgi:hypothetical protein